MAYFDNEKAIEDSHSGDSEESYVLAYNAVESVESQQTFRKDR
jgi:hypothetical protein